MSEDPQSSPTPPQQSTDALTATGIANIERTFLRLTFWQTLLSLAGVFTGAVALYAALNESEAVRQQTAASVWPYVQLSVNNTANEESADFSVQLSNVGAGPAKLITARLVLDGDVFTQWSAAVEHLLGVAEPPGIRYGKYDVVRRVISPGETVTAFVTEDRELAIAMQLAVERGAAAFSYCYCSIFDDCWVSQPSGATANFEPHEVDACPDFGEDTFRN